MTLFVDTSALVHRYLATPERALVDAAMADDPVWCASALCLTEARMALRRLAADQRQLDRLWAALAADWDTIASVPVDHRCLGHAAELGTTYGLRTVDAVHLAAADRLPRPVRYLTLDGHQLPAAVALGFEVVSPLAT